jgi:hypothetical protein
MSYDEIVAWTSMGSLGLFLGLAIYITIRVYRPSQRAKMEQWARLPIDT